MLDGQESDFKSIPITAHHVVKNVVFVREYIGDDEKAVETKFNLKDICNSCTLPSESGNIIQLLKRNNIYQKTFLLGTDIYGRVY